MASGDQPSTWTIDASVSSTAEKTATLYLAFPHDLTQPPARWSLAGIDEVRVARRQSGHPGIHRITDGRRGLLAFHVDDPWVSSRQPVSLTRVGADWRLVDSGSTNGTDVNGRRTSDVLLADGDVIRLGQTFVIFRWEAEPADRPAAPLLDPAFATLLPGLEETFSRIAQAATSDWPCLLTGETGVGKEVVAQAIHRLSRRHGQLIAVNCAAIPRELVESQLFGHEKGAFTGAGAARAGLIRSADTGTLFLDEVGDLPLPAQAVLLRVLQDKRVLPVGAETSEPVDFRLICATNRDLQALIGQGTFREDLYARLAHFEEKIPPLRERREDLGLLITAILQHHVPDRVPTIRFDAPAATSLFLYDWPRNVRELEMCLTRAVHLAGDERISPQHLPPAVARLAPDAGEGSSKASAADSAQPAASVPPDDSRRAELIGYLQRYQGNVTRISEAVGKSRKAVDKWLKKYGLRAEDYRKP